MSIWLVVWNMSFIVPFSWECHHPNWLIFFRGVAKKNQPLWYIHNIIPSYNHHITTIIGILTTIVLFSHDWWLSLLYPYDDTFHWLSYFSWLLKPPTSVYIYIHLFWWLFIVLPNITFPIPTYIYIHIYIYIRAMAYVNLLEANL